MAASSVLLALVSCALVLGARASGNSLHPTAWPGRNAPLTPAAVASAYWRLELPPCASAQSPASLSMLQVAYASSSGMGRDTGAAGGLPLTGNLVNNATALDTRQSGTAILTSAGEIHVAWCNASALVAPRSDTGKQQLVQRVYLGPVEVPVATELWTLAVDATGRTLSWTVEREWLQATSVVGDRSPTLSLPTAEHAASSYFDPDLTGPQIAGFYDPGLYMDYTPAARPDNVHGATAGDFTGYAGPRGFPFFTSSGFAAAAPHWYEFQSETTSQELRLSPAGIRVGATLSVTSGAGAVPRFTVAKEAADGTASLVSLGVSTVDRRSTVTTPHEFPSGATVTSSLTLTWEGGLLAAVDDGNRGTHSQAHKAASAASYGQLNLTVPTNPALATALGDFVRLHTMFDGWIMGNNPASVVCLHEAAFFSWILSVLPASNTAAFSALRQELQFLLTYGVNANGYVMPRWCSGGFYNVTWGPLHDQVPHIILAVHSYVVSTGDRQFLQHVWPTVQRVAGYMLRQGVAATGVFIVPGASGLPNGGKHASNWYDIIEFGHKDAYIGAYVVAAAEAMVDMHGYLGNATGAASWQQLHARSVAAYNDAFWSDEHGFYADWVDVDGHARFYFYTDQNLLSIILGIANATQSSSILAALDEHYGQLCTRFGVARDKIYATPANVAPVTTLGDLMFNGTLNDQKKYPDYENGCSFFHSTGFEIAARAVAGDTSGALAVLERVMGGDGWGHNRFWGAANNWALPGNLLTSEPLNDSLIIVTGALRGLFGVWPTLSGLGITGGSPRGRTAGAYGDSAWEGARWVFAYLGQDVCLQVRGGRTARCA